MRHNKCRHCPNVQVEDSCKVFGLDFKWKGGIGSTKGVTDDGIYEPTNKTPYLSSVLLCLVISKPN